MRLDLDNLPSDMALLHGLLRDMAAVVQHRDGEIERLQTIIKQLQRTQFGRRSERLDPASNWSARPLPAGSAARAGGSRRWTIACARTCSPPIICSPTTRRSRSSIRAADYARDQRPWGRPAPPAAVYIFAPDRRAERPVAHLEHFKGVLHVEPHRSGQSLHPDVSS
jgi:hypothetical protein